MSKAFRYHQHGGPEVLRFEDVEVGAPGPGQVRIRNKAVAVNYRDVLMRKGIHAVKSFPAGIGLESAGVIDAVGPGVEGFAVGDRVAYAGMPEGSYAEERIVPVTRLLALPDGIDERMAASMMIRGMTARTLLYDAYKVQPGDTILIHAAAGGVGLIVCQWAKHLGATVIGTRRPRSRARTAAIMRSSTRARISPSACVRSPAAKACRWSTIRSAGRRSKARSSACAGAA
jgi:NADPH2:quinone reductase